MTTCVPLDIDRIRELRIGLDYSMAEAARRAGMRSAQQWNQIENGERRNPSIHTVQRVAHALGVSVDDLLTPLEGDEWKDG